MFFFSAFPDKTEIQKQLVAQISSDFPSRCDRPVGDTEHLTVASISYLAQLAVQLVVSTLWDQSSRGMTGASWLACNL